MLYADRLEQDTEGLAERVFGLRAQRGWSQVELSRRSGVTQATISSLEGARRVPTLPTLRKISKAFGISVRELLSEKPDTTTLTEPQEDLGGVTGGRQVS